MVPSYLSIAVVAVVDEDFAMAEWIHAVGVASQRESHLQTDRSSPTLQLLKKCNKCCRTCQGKAQTRTRQGYVRYRHGAVAPVMVPSCRRAVVEGGFAMAEWIR